MPMETRGHAVIPSTKWQGGAAAVIAAELTERLTDGTSWAEYSVAAVILFLTWFFPEMFPPQSAVE